MNSQREFHRKCAIITGGNSGLGFQVAKNISNETDWRVIVASRTRDKNLKAVEKIKRKNQNAMIESRVLDLGSIESIKQFTDWFLNREDIVSLNAIVCNAGVSISTGTQYTTDGIEKTFGVNHLGHFYLVKLLLPHMSVNGRIVNVTSGVHNRTDDNPYMKGPRYTDAMTLAYPDKYDQQMGSDESEIGARRYATSKLCNVLFTYELDRRLKSGQLKAADGITVNAYTPGFMPGTDLGRHSKGFSRIMFKYIFPLFRPLSKNIVSPSESGKVLSEIIISDKYKSVSGKYYEVGREERSSTESYNENLAHELWENSEKIIRTLTRN